MCIPHMMSAVVFYRYLQIGGSFCKLLRSNPAIFAAAVRYKRIHDGILAMLKC
jgi:hypothetical protein